MKVYLTKKAMNLKSYLLSSSRGLKQIIVLSTDFISLSFALYFALIASKESFSAFHLFDQIRILSIPFLATFIFWILGVYSSVIRYIDTSVVFILLRAVSYSIFFIFIVNSLSILVWSSINGMSFSYVLDIRYWFVGIITFSFAILSSRLIAHFLFSDREAEKKVIIYGAGSAGIQLASALRVSREMQPIAFLDENKSLQGSYLGNLKVFNPNKLDYFINRKKVDEVLIAMPSVSKLTLRNLLKEIEQHSIKVRILPGLAALAEGKVAVSELKEVDVLDLLDRLEVQANEDLLRESIENKVVLITGAGGSIGSEISLQVAQNKADKIILLDSNEYALYSIQKEVENLGTEISTYTVLASVVNKARIKEVCEAFKVQTLYHAAAYKHVSIVEENPFEAVQNNIYGTKHAAEAAEESNVETFVLVSTDKAVRPTNIMGATKRFSEQIIQSLAIKSRMKMSMVRFGNVVGSSGSAIPLFQEQIKKGGPVTVTHPEVIRYFMSIPEAAELVIQAGAMAEGGDVFVLDMGEPVKIYDLAKRLIHLSGMEIKDEKNPDGDIEIIFTGLRPGEKLYEELLIGNNVSKTEHKQILRAEEEFLELEKLEMYLDTISEAEKNADVEALRNILKKVVSGFTPEKEIADVVYLQKNKD